MSIVCKILDTPLGKMRAAASDEGICVFDFAHRNLMPAIISRVEKYNGAPLQEGDHPYFEKITKQVNEYFSGQRKEFDLPLHLIGSDFQVRVWKALLEIPYGETRSYKQQSIAVGDLLAIRAVAKANGENSLAIIVPCHRVIGSNGELTGYAGGLDKKKWLLSHERTHSGQHQQAELFG